MQGGVEGEPKPPALANVRGGLTTARRLSPSYKRVLRVIAYC
jgi:hypothetical protein